MSRLLLFCVFICVSAKISQEKCRLTDSPCMLNLANNIYSAFFTISNELDPMHINIIEGNLPNMKYKFTDFNTKGFRECKKDYTKLDLENLILDSTHVCPYLEMTGKYKITGHLQNVPIEGHGTITILASQYSYKLNCDIELKSSKGQSHIHVKDYKLELDSWDRVIYEMDNFFNGAEENDASVLKMFDDNWKEIHDHIIKSHVQKIVDVSNEYFRNNPVEDHISL